MGGDDTTPETGRRWDAIVVHPDDDVAVALRDIPAGTAIDARRDGAIVRVAVVESIGLGHKIALHPIARGAPVLKYGECIGVATADIAAGAHVHIQNMASRRALGTA